MAWTVEGVDIPIESLCLEINYDFMRKPSNIKNLSIVVDDRLGPYFVLDVADISNRKDGSGTFHRSYSPNTSVSVEAPHKYGEWIFKGWFDRYGTLVSDDPEIDVFLNSDKYLKARYEPLFLTVSGRVGNSEGIGICNYDVTVNVDDIGSVNLVTDDFGIFSTTVPNDSSGSINVGLLAPELFTDISEDFECFFTLGNYSVETAPENVNACDGLSARNIMVTWDIEEGYYYKVYRSEVGSDELTDICDWTADLNSYADDGATPGIDYSYYVRAALDADGSGTGATNSDNGCLLMEVYESDINRDNVVDYLDFIFLAEDWLKDNTSLYQKSAGDIDENSDTDTVDLKDLEIFADQWLSGT